MLSCIVSNVILHIMGVFIATSHAVIMIIIILKLIACTDELSLTKKMFFKIPLRSATPAECWRQSQTPVNGTPLRAISPLTVGLSAGTSTSPIASPAADQVIQLC